MAREGALRELGRFSEEYRRATAGRGTPYPCTQEQIDIYTVEPLCCRGNNYAMSEEDATRMLVDFLDPRRAPTHKVFSALQRIANAMFTVDDWYLDVVIKAASDIDTAFFMGYLRGNVSINWISRLRLAELGHGARHMLGSTYPGSHGCSSVWLNTQAIFDETEFPRRKMWQVLFHELIHAFCFAVCHTRQPTSYDRAHGWNDGHGYMFRQCLRAIEERTKTYFDGLCISTD